MAVLSKIRQKSALLIAVIGIALLAFVIGDVVRSTGGGMARNVGSVNGEDINTQEFLHKVAQAEKNGQMTNAQANAAVWNNEVNSILLQGELDKLGIEIGSDQLVNVVATHPMFANDPQFQNELGQFSVAKFNQFVATMKQAGPEQWAQWLAYEKELEKYGLQQLYYNIVQGGMYVTDLDAKFAYAKENDKVTFDYVTVPYNTVDNSEAKIDDAAIVNYMKKHQNAFKSEPTRVLQYAYIASEPSDADKEVVKETIDDLLKPMVTYNDVTKTNDTVAGFKTTTNVIDFVNLNSDIKFDTLFYAKKELPLEHQEALFNLAPTEVYGPYIMGDYYCVTRLVDKKADVKVDAAHILIGYQGASASAATRTKEQAKEKAEDLLKQINANPESFSALAMVETEDAGSKNNGGKYEGITKGNMVKPFEDFIFNNPTGKIGIIETDFGYHIVKVLAKDSGVRLATLARTIEVSDATADELFTKASTLEQQLLDNSDFEKSSKDLAFTIQNDIVVRPFEENLPGVGSQRSIVSWSFNKDTKQGDIKRFDNPEGHVIVRVVTKDDSGLMPVTEARRLVEPILMNEIKADIIAKKFTGSTIEEVSTATGASIKQIAATTLQAPLILGVGYEPLVVGTAFATKVNDNSKPINGLNGVYMVKTKEVSIAETAGNYNAYKTALTNMQNQMIQMRLMQVLKEQAAVKDNRIGVVQ